MLIGIDYQRNGMEWPTVVQADSRDAGEAQFRRENPHVTLVRSWVYPDQFEKAIQASATQPAQPFHPRLNR